MLLTRRRFFLVIIRKVAKGAAILACYPEYTTRERERERGEPRARPKYGKAMFNLVGLACFTSGSSES